MGWRLSSLLKPGTAQGSDAARAGADWARAEHRNSWTRDAVIGDPSWDNFARAPGNPIYVGREPFPWSVNGSLFHDPCGGNWYAYPALYPRNYWPAGPCALLRSADDGRSWQDLGLALQGDPLSFDQGGATPDVSLLHADGAYHMVYDWVTPDCLDGGIAYAKASSPEGPFRKSSRPIHAESRQEALLGRYKRVYLSTLLRREADWLILSAMSTPGNAGNSWALVAFTAGDPADEWRGPEMLLCPEEGAYLPQPVEFNHAFVFRGEVFVAASSVSRNRTYQLLYRAPLAQAHRAESWEIHQEGSLWHWEPGDYETLGIWGQSFCAVAEEGRVTALYPSRNGADRGTLSLATRPWDVPFKDGFVLSAPNAQAVTFTRQSFEDVTLRLRAASSGAFQVLWGCASPLGPDRPYSSEGEPSPHTLRGFPSLRLHAEGWEVWDTGEDGQRSLLARGRLPEAASESWDLELTWTPEVACWKLGATLLWRGAACRQSGLFGLLAEPGSCLRVHGFETSTGGKKMPLVLLPYAGTMGAGLDARDWQPLEAGRRVVASRAGARAKFNFLGGRFRLLASAEDFEVSTNLPPGGDTLPRAVAVKAKRAGAELEGLEFEP